jgi:flagellar biosynthesis/type III secretory pathway chaperone
MSEIDRLNNELDHVVDERDRLLEECKTADATIKDLLKLFRIELAIDNFKTEFNTTSRPLQGSILEELVRQRATILEDLTRKGLK